MTSNDNVLTVEMFNAGMNEIKSEIQALKIDIQGVKSEIQVIKGDIQALKNDVQELKNEVRVIDKNLAVNSGKVEVLQTSINLGLGIIAIVVAFVIAFIPYFKREKSEKQEKFLTVENVKSMIDEAVAKALITR